MEIALMSKLDIPQAVEIERVSFSVPWTRAMFISELDNPLCLYYTAREAERLLGYAGMLSILDEGYVNNIAVAPEARRRGIGALLIKTLIKTARCLSLRFLTLEVRQSNRAAISLYSGLGFKKTGIRRSYYERPREDAVLMTLYI
mgnify:CR=1 FL=1